MQNMILVLVKRENVRNVHAYQYEDQMVRMLIMSQKVIATYQAKYSLSPSHGTLCFSGGPLFPHLESCLYLQTCLCF